MRPSCIFLIQILITAYEVILSNLVCVSIPNFEDIVSVSKTTIVETLAPVSESILLLSLNQSAAPFVMAM